MTYSRSALLSIPIGKMEKGKVIQLLTNLIRFPRPPAVALRELYVRMKWASIRSYFNNPLPRALEWTGILPLRDTGPHGVTHAANSWRTLVPQISRHISRSNNKQSTVFFAICFRPQTTSCSPSGSEYYPVASIICFISSESLAGQVILSIAYGINVLPENDPYVAEAENVLRALAVSTTKEALLLDSIPWCIYYQLISKQKLIRVAVIKMPSWFPGARYKRYARKWNPIVVGAVKATYNKVESELVSVEGASSHIRLVMCLFRLPERPLPLSLQSLFRVLKRTQRRRTYGLLGPSLLQCIWVAPTLWV